jgi:membrane associated rhomboid family serine protease
MLDIIAQPVEKDTCVMSFEQEFIAVPPNARIPTRNRRRAMDWSLALASQGIESAIENDPETGWALVVSTADAVKAREVIEQYRRENLRWPWRQRVPKTGVVFDWAAALWVALTVAFFWFESERALVRDAGVMDSVAVARGEWWRLFTAELLHADTMHLATNSVFGLLLLGLAMGRYGTGVALLAAYLAGAAGNVVSWLVHERPIHGLGASGVVMGALGLLAAQSVAMLRQNPRPFRLALGGLAGGVMLFVLLGLSPGTDIAAHLGGFVAGILFGAAFAPFPKLGQRPVVNVAAGILFAAIVVWTWARALNAGATP